MRVPLPPPVPPVAPLGVDDAAAEVTRAVRAGGSVLAEVHRELATAGTPGEWSGRTTGTAGSAARRLVRDVDAATAALEVATRGLEVFEEQVGDLTRRRTHLVADAAGCNAAIRDLRARVVAHPDADPATVAGWDLEAEALTRRRDAVANDDVVLRVDLRTAEDRLIGVLASVDTAPGGARAAAAPARPDTDALARRLHEVLGDPQRVHRWWTGLTEAQRQALLLHRPDLVGGADGVPLADRDDANRSSLAAHLAVAGVAAALGGGLTAAQQRRLRQARAVQDALAAAPGAPVVLLVVYDPDAFGGDGAGAVAVGDPDTADHVVVLVPGLTSDLAGLPGLTDDAVRIQEQAHDHDPDRTTAAVAWIGYDAPTFTPPDVGAVPGEGADLLGVTDEGAAERGGHALVDLVDGLHATDAGPPAHLTVVGHSYGSTTVAHAAADGLDADAVVLLGSPGAGGGVADVDDLGFDGDVYVGAADHDPVTWLGAPGGPGLGQDPAQDSFGAVRFEVEPGESFHVHELGPVGFEQNHSAYLDEGSRSLDNLGLVVTGQQPDVVPGRDEPARDHLTDWLAGEADHWVDEGRGRAEDWLEDRLDGLGGLGGLAPWGR